MGPFPTGLNLIVSNLFKILKQVVCANGEHTRSHGEGKKGVMEKKREKLSWRGKEDVS